MTHLADAIRSLDLEARMASSGCWAEMEGERCWVFVVEQPGGNAFLTWCDDSGARTIERHYDPVSAIQADLRRAEGERPGGSAPRRADR